MILYPWVVQWGNIDEESFLVSIEQARAWFRAATMQGAMREGERFPRGPLDYALRRWREAKKMDLDGSNKQLARFRFLILTAVSALSLPNVLQTIPEIDAVYIRKRLWPMVRGVLVDTQEQVLLRGAVV